MSQKTEQPTPKKLRDARKKGQVAKSKEIVSLVMLLSITGCFWFFGDNMLEQMKQLFQLPSRYMFTPWDDLVAPVFFDLLSLTAQILAPIIITTFVFGIISNAGQIGWLLSFEPIKLSLKKISIVQGAKKIFSTKNLMEFVKSVVKIVVLSYTAWYVLEKNMLLILQVPHCGAECALSITASLVMKLILYCLGVFIFLASADYALERFLHFKKLKMSKDEVKREYKDTEGSPEVKGRRKELHRELMNEEAMVKRVEQADVVITNPVHFAVCIRYDDKISKLPFVTMKGEFLLAQKIKKLAEARQIPIVENVPLARALYAQIDIDQTITASFIEPVADIIRWLRTRSPDEPFNGHPGA